MAYPHNGPATPFQYVKLGDFTYHILTDPGFIKNHLTKWILREWKQDHNEAPEEHWSVAWIRIFPQLEFSLEIVGLREIRPHPDLWNLQKFQDELRERANEREWSMLSGVSIEPLIVNHRWLQLMDGYTRYVALNRYDQTDVFAYVGRA
jgi:hypothetical protein